MLVFVVETVTGGDFAATELPTSLIAEGTLMRDALIGDLEDLPGVRVVTTHDARLSPPPRGQSTPVSAGGDPRAIWADLAGQAHCCWPIAPETDGVLKALVARLRDHSRRVIAADAETLEACTSKAGVARRLAAAGVPAIQALDPSDIPEGSEGPFIVKPDDGAGAVDVRVFARMPALPLPASAILQTLVEGTPASLSLLCQDGRAHALCANRQHIVRVDGQLRFAGVTVGAFPIDAPLQAIARGVIAALPGLHGIVGLDYIATPDGPVVVEVNPRLTTSYAGLRAALGVNPVAFVAELIRDGAVPDVPHLPPALPVEVRL